MQKRNRTTAVSESTVQAALRRAPARQLDAEEDRAMRMRLGASVPRTAPLERKPAGTDDAEIEILAAEIELFMRMRDELRAHAARRGAAAARQPSASAPTAAAPSRQTSPTKAKIIRALRKHR